MLMLHADDPLYIPCVGNHVYPNELMCDYASLFMHATDGHESIFGGYNSVENKLYTTKKLSMEEGSATANESGGGRRSRRQRRLGPGGWGEGHGGSAAGAEAAWCGRRGGAR